MRQVHLPDLTTPCEPAGKEGPASRPCPRGLTAAAEAPPCAASPPLALLLSGTLGPSLAFSVSPGASLCTVASVPLSLCLGCSVFRCIAVCCSLPLPFILPEPEFQTCLLLRSLSVSLPLSLLSVLDSCFRLRSFSFRISVSLSLCVSLSISLSLPPALPLQSLPFPPLPAEPACQGCQETPTRGAGAGKKRPWAPCLRLPTSGTLKSTRTSGAADPPASHPGSPSLGVHYRRCAGPDNRLP